MYPNFIFWANPETDHLSKQAEKLLKSKGHKIKDVKLHPNWFTDYSSFIIIGRDLEAYNTNYYPKDSILLVICYWFPIDEKDMLLIHKYWHAFFTEEPFYFPRWGGLLEHFVNPPPVESLTAIE